MDYSVCKLHFTTPVHFGRGTLDSCDCFLGADTIFSALCCEAVSADPSGPDELVGWVNEGKLLLSDAFPFSGKDCFLPKPMLHIESTLERAPARKGSSLKKKFKKLRYIPIREFENFLRGTFDIEGDVYDFRKMGTMDLRTAVALRGQEEPEPFRIASFTFSGPSAENPDEPEKGLYFIMGYERDNRDRLFDLIRSLGYSGIGGKRSSGMGHFTASFEDVPAGIRKRLSSEGKCLMSLSFCLPQDDELETALEGAVYSVALRTGFVASESYAPEQRRKKDLCMLRSGSCFVHPFRGGIRDVSEEHGAHPVYRYARPLFLEVSQ